MMSVSPEKSRQTHCVHVREHRLLVLTPVRVTLLGGRHKVSWKRQVFFYIIPYTYILEYYIKTICMYINVIKSTHANSGFRYWGNLYVNAWVYIVYTIYMQIYTVSCSPAAVVCTNPQAGKNARGKDFCW